MHRVVKFIIVSVFLLLGRYIQAATGSSFEDLLANLKSPNAKTRQEAAGALGKSRRREAVTPLAALVHDPEPRVRLEVVKALCQLRDPSSIPALVASMRDVDSKVREESIGALVEIHAERERSTPVDRFLEVFSDEFDRSLILPHHPVDPSIYKALILSLRDEEKEIREEAALAIGILGGRSVVKDLLAVLQDPEARVRGAVATAIGKVGTSKDGKALIPLLADDAIIVRNRTLQAIGVLKVKEAGPALRQLYESNRRKESGLRILECLSRIGDAEQADLFRELVADPDPERRRLAVEGLGRVSDVSLLTAFKKDYQRERHEELKLAYSFAMTLMGDRAFLDSIVLCLPSKTLGRRCRNYILEMGATLFPDIYEYLNDPEADIRAELCDILGALGDSNAIPRLTPLINDPSVKVADRANRAVERLRLRAASSL